MGYFSEMDLMRGAPSLLDEIAAVRGEEIEPVAEPPLHYRVCGIAHYGADPEPMAEYTYFDEAKAQAVALLNGVWYYGGTVVHIESGRTIYTATPRATNDPLPETVADILAEMETFCPAGEPRKRASARLVWNWAERLRGAMSEGR